MSFIILVLMLTSKLLLRQRTRSVAEFLPTSPLGVESDDGQKLEQLALQLRPTVQSLVTKPFFRYFKATLDCNCTLFQSETEAGMCGLSHCGVGLCSSSELPPGIKHWSGDVDISGVSPNCCDWSESDCEWTSDDESAYGPGIAVVDLVRNPERDTGYVGERPRQVWQHVHSTCCGSQTSLQHNKTLSSLCKLASGMHSSVTTHIARERGALGGARDLQLFKDSLLSEPQRIANLYFTFAFVARAVKGASPSLESAKYGTGSSSIIDWRTNRLVRELVRKVSSSSIPSQLQGELSGVDERELRHRFKHGVYDAMDCVTCDRCRLWGKLQSLGVATALKCALADDNANTSPACVTDSNNGHATLFRLGRLEAVALINLLARLTDSVYETQVFLAALDDEDDAELDGSITQLSDSSTRGNSITRIPSSVHDVVSRPLEHST